MKGELLVNLNLAESVLEMVGKAPGLYFLDVNPMMVNVVVMPYC